MIVLLPVDRSNYVTPACLWTILNRIWIMKCLLFHLDLPKHLRCVFYSPIFVFLLLSISSPIFQVNLRPKRLHMKGNRPWSVSCLSQLSHTSPIKTPSDILPNFSISESALNKLTVLSPTSVKTRSFATSTNSIGVQGNNSTSSTVEESGVMFLNEGSKAVSSRKKKMRFRRKHMVCAYFLTNFSSSTFLIKFNLKS